MYGDKFWTAAEADHELSSSVRAMFPKIDDYDILTFIDHSKQLYMGIVKIYYYTTEGDLPDGYVDELITAVQENYQFAEDAAKFLDGSEDIQSELLMKYTQAILSRCE
jgi:hypothetical protein